MNAIAISGLENFILVHVQALESDFDEVWLVTHTTLTAPAVNLEVGNRQYEDGRKQTENIFKRDWKVSSRADKGELCDLHDIWDRMRAKGWSWKTVGMAEVSY